MSISKYKYTTRIGDLYSMSLININKEDPRYFQERIAPDYPLVREKCWTVSNSGWVPLKGANRERGFNLYPKHLDKAPYLGEVIVSYAKIPCLEMLTYVHTLVFTQDPKQPILPTLSTLSYLTKLEIRGDINLGSVDTLPLITRLHFEGYPCLEKLYLTKFPRLRHLSLLYANVKACKANLQDLRYLKFLTSLSLINIIPHSWSDLSHATRLTSLHLGLEPSELTPEVLLEFIPHLKSLKVLSIPSLEDWSVIDEHLPNLQELYITVTDTPNLKPLRKRPEVKVVYHNRW